MMHGPINTKYVVIFYNIPFAVYFAMEWELIKKHYFWNTRVPSIEWITQEL